MSHLDWIVASVQISSQLNGGDEGAANETAKNLIMSVPGLPYIIAGVMKSLGDDEEAKKVFKDANNRFINATNSIPVIGHIKGVVLYIRHDFTKGNEVMASATRSAVVLFAGGAGVMLGGVFIGFAMAVGAGIIWDVVIYLITRGKIRSGLSRINRKNPWSVVHALVGVFRDGMTGSGGVGDLPGSNLPEVDLTQPETAEKNQESVDPVDCDCKPPDNSLPTTKDETNNSCGIARKKVLRKRRFKNKKFKIADFYLKLSQQSMLYLSMHL